MLLYHMTQETPWEVVDKTQNRQEVQDHLPQRAPNKLQQGEEMRPRNTNHIYIV